MSAYDNDPRVTYNQQYMQYELAVPGAPGDDVLGIVEAEDLSRWKAWILQASPASLDLLGERGQKVLWYPSCDEAINSLIGDPK